MTAKTARTAVLAALLAGSATASFASGGTVGEEMEGKIRTFLTDQGYEVRKIEMEDGLYEAYALKNGEKLEIYLDDNLEIVRSKSDD